MEKGGVVQLVEREGEGGSSNKGVKVEDGVEKGKGGSVTNTVGVDGEGDGEGEKEEVLTVEGKVRDIMRKVLNDQVDFSGEIRTTGGFFHSVYHHTVEKVEQYYPWSLLLLVPVFMIIFSCLLPSPDYDRVKDKEE